MTPDDARHVLAIDLGTGGPKVALVASDGTVVGHEVETNGLLLTEDGGVEQDPEEWWRSIRTATHRLLDRELVPRASVTAVAVTAQWMGTVPVDAQGRHIANAVIWMDDRGSRHAQEASGGGVTVPTVGYNAAKLRTWLQVTGGVPSRTGKDPVGHMLFLKHERPEVYRAAHALVEPVDHLNARLTGRICASYDTITGYWATDNRDLGRVDYVDELVEWIGIDRTKLPDLVPTGSIIGTVTAEAAAELGIDAGAAVVTGCGDTASAAIGSGGVTDLDAHLYIGTSSWLSCHVPAKKTDILHNITTLPSGIPGRYWVATEQDCAGKCLTNLIDEILYPDDGLGGPPPNDVFERLNDVAAGVPAGSGGVIFTPWLNGERTPVDDHLIRGGWHNVSLATRREHLVRSVFEGVALNTRWMHRSVERFVKQRVDPIRFVGGGAQSDLWCQIHADVLDRTILKVRDPRLANVRGAAITALVALGDLSWDQVPGLVEIEATFHPDPATRAVYDRHADAFVSIYKRNKGIHAKLNRHR